jgi:threonine-phosphate decarboxylase
LSERVKKIILKNIGALIHYPEADSQVLKNIISSFHNINQSNVLVGNGSIELVHLIPRALKAKNVLIVGPTFSEYEFAARSSGARLFFLLASEQDDFRIDVCRMEKFMPKADLIFLCNPNNPTAFLMPKSDILDLLDLCKGYMVIDEAFMDFVRGEGKISLATDAVKYNRLLVIRSLTKFFALAGLRLGYLIGQRRIIEHISRFQYPWNVNSLAQIAAREVFKDKDYIKLSQKFILEERDYLFENLRKIKGIRVYSPSANFIFCKLETCNLKDSVRLDKKLLKDGIIIRCCHNFRGLDNRFFRVAVRTRSENKRLISCLKKVLP